MDSIYRGRFSVRDLRTEIGYCILPTHAESIKRKSAEEYLRTFLKLVGKYSFHLCTRANDVKL